jgi:hypothetical protein
MPTKQTEKKGKVVVQYFHDGKPISAYQNKLSSIAYWYTAGIRGATVNESGHESLSSKQLVALLVRLGAEDPKTKAFDVTLPNGVRIHSKIGKLLVSAPKAKTKPAKRAPTKTRASTRKTAPATKSTAKKAVKSTSVGSRSRGPKAPRRPTAAQRAERLEQAKNEAALVQAWEEGGKVGDRPLTPAIDAMEAQPSKGADAVTNQGQGVKPTNKDKKVPRQRKTPTKSKDTPVAETPSDPRDAPDESDAPPPEVAETEEAQPEVEPTRASAEQASEMASV